MTTGVFFPSFSQTIVIPPIIIAETGLVVKKRSTETPLPDTAGVAGTVGEVKQVSKQNEKANGSFNELVHHHSSVHCSVKTCGYGSAMGIPNH